jgi:feruloyl esterase
VIGGRDETQEFLRLFILPGVGHCSGGDGAYSVDYLSYIEDWVENGEAPDKLISERPSGDEIPEWLLPISNDPGQAKFRRPVFPYTHRAIYDGLGDPNDVKSFSRSTLDQSVAPVLGEAHYSTGMSKSELPRACAPQSVRP